MHGRFFEDIQPSHNLSSSPDKSWRFKAAWLVFAALAMLLSILPSIVELPAHISKDYNEGWNAYLTDLAWSGENLYVDLSEFYSNNYPPLSFYLVGAIGDLVGDNIIAGRILSLIALFIIAGNIFFVLRLLGADIFSSALSGLAFLSFMGQSHPVFVAMNDPQILGHAFMTLGLLLFCLSMKNGNSLYLILSAVLMILAILIKHMLVPTPIAVTIWLLCYDRKKLFLWVSAVSGIAVICLLVFYLSYGDVLFSSILMSPRLYSVSAAFFGLAKWTVALQLWIFAAIVLALAFWKRPAVTILSLYTAISAAWGLFTLGGEGVDRNAVFDLIIATVMSSGYLLALAARNMREVVSAPIVTSIAALALFMPILFSLPLAPQRLAETWINVPYMETVVAEDVAFVRDQDGPVMCEDLALCYWAGKPLEVDYFNLGQKVKAGAIAQEGVVSLFEARHFSLIQISWMNHEGGTYRFPQALNEAISKNYAVVRESAASGSFLAPKAKLENER